MGYLSGQCPGRCWPETHGVADSFGSARMVRYTKAAMASTGGRSLWFIAEPSIAAELALKVPLVWNVCERESAESGRSANELFSLGRQAT